MPRPPCAASHFLLDPPLAPPTPTPGEALALSAHCSSEAEEQDRFPYLADPPQRAGHTCSEPHNERATHVPLNPMH